MIIKFFSMPRIVPLVLPLSILFHNDFGNLAENYEFAAMKSPNFFAKSHEKFDSIHRFIICTSFSNNVIPYMEYKFIISEKTLHKSNLHWL
jgi:hypothetical protein